MKFEPCIEFEKPIDIADIWDLRDLGKIWTIPKPIGDYGPGLKRTKCPLLQEETKEILRLFIRNNLQCETHENKIDYPGFRRPIPFEIDCNADKVAHENYLVAWLLKNLDTRVVEERIGKANEFISWVPTSHGQIMDIVCLHEREIEPFDKAVFAGYSVIECKKDACTEENLKQLATYVDWVAIKRADGYRNMVQGIIIASDFNPELVEYAKDIAEFEGRTPFRLVKYRANPKGIELENVAP